MSTTALAETVILDCTLSCHSDCTSNDVSNITLRIDREHHTVFIGDNSYPATISTAFIIWSVRWDGKYSLNRSTLGLVKVRFNSRDGDDFNMMAPIYEGICRKGTNQI